MMAADRRLEGFLDKFAHLTEVILEASQIKEKLKTPNAEFSKDALQYNKVELLVKKLVRYTDDIKAGFSNRIEPQLDAEVAGNQATTSGSSMQGDTKSGLKLIDIRKLTTSSEVPPSTVIVIGSSDEDNAATETSPRKPQTHKKKKSSTVSKHCQSNVNAPKKSAQSKRSVDVFDGIASVASLENSDIDEDGTGSSEDDDDARLTVVKNGSRAAATNREYPNIDKNDPSFQLCYVKMLRTPVDAMKEYFDKKIKDDEINALTNLRSLTIRQRRKTSRKKENKLLCSNVSKSPKPSNKSVDRDSVNSDSDSYSSLCSQVSTTEASESFSTVNETVLQTNESNNSFKRLQAADDLEQLDSAPDDDDITSGDNEESLKSKEHTNNNQKLSVKKNPRSKTRREKESKESTPESSDRESASSIHSKSSEKKLNRLLDELEKDPEKQKSKEDSSEQFDRSETGQTDNIPHTTGISHQSIEQDGTCSKSTDKLQEEGDNNDTHSEQSPPKKKTKKPSTSNADSEGNSTDSDKSPKNKNSTETHKSDNGNNSDSDSASELIAKKSSKKIKNTRKKQAIRSDSESNNDKSNSSNKKESSDEERLTSTKTTANKDAQNNKKTRRRIKRMRSSSSSGNSSDERPSRRKRKNNTNDDRNTKDQISRKNIRRVWKENALTQSTVDAEKEERLRKARLSDKQKRYNSLFGISNRQSDKVEKVVLDFDEKTHEELLSVNDELVAHLKPHQASGIQFMWNACFESLERLKTWDGSGCILAHCMGLGKTLQVIALVHTLLKNEAKTNVHRVLVVCPFSTVLNWISEFHLWLKDDETVEVYELINEKQAHRHYKVQHWHEFGGVLVLSYNLFRMFANPKSRSSKKVRRVYETCLIDPGPDLIVCDEGHLLKNSKSSINIAMTRVKTLKRIVLTGTPLQNNLREYYCMIQFVKQNLLGTYREYMNRFVNPIVNGQYTDSTAFDIQLMRKRSHVLHRMLDGVVQRRDYSVLEPYLPPKYEYVLLLQLSDMQVQLYNYYMENLARRNVGNTTSTMVLFSDFQHLQRICTHPKVLQYKAQDDIRKAQQRIDNEDEEEDDDDEDSNGSLKDFIDDDGTSENEGASSSGSEVMPVSHRRVTRSSKPIENVNGIVAEAGEGGEGVKAAETENAKVEYEQEWWRQFCTGEELETLSHGTKLFLLFRILKECEEIGDKLLVFSQSLYSLTVIEHFLRKIDEDQLNGSQDESIKEVLTSWSLGLDYFRMDGSSSCGDRHAWCKMFNDPNNHRARLFLISTRAGGLGINLVAANRVIIFDVSWNPSHDVQSIYRVYRFGQTKPCYIYRFVTNGTMERKLYDRQIIKQSISKRVIDEQQIDRHYNQSDIESLYAYNLRPPDRPTPSVPKDVLLGEMLHKYKDLIFSYHLHQSLLENKHEDCLTEEERKVAWEEFEQEKKAEQLRSQPLIVQPNQLPDQTFKLALYRMMKRENPRFSDLDIMALVPGLLATLKSQLAVNNRTLFARMYHDIITVQMMYRQANDANLQPQTQTQPHSSFQTASQNAALQTSTVTSTTQHMPLINLID